MSDIFDRVPSGFKRHPTARGWIVPHSTSQDKKVKALRANNEDLLRLIADLSVRLERLENVPEVKEPKPKNGKKK